jgi:hypothetical protein
LTILIIVYMTLHMQLYLGRVGPKKLNGNASDGDGTDGDRRMKDGHHARRSLVP